MSRPPAQVLADLGRPRLLVVGDLVLDRYLTGVVERVSPEAPIQVLQVRHEEERLGGAGSVAANVAVLGAEATLAGVVGRDVAAERLRALAEEAGVRLLAVDDASRRTSVKTRHVARGQASAQQVLRVDEESVRPLDAATEEALRRRLEEALPAAEAVLVSDYGKGVCTPALLTWLIRAARDLGRPVVVDPKGDEFRRYRGATALTPNRAETQAATGIPVGHGDLEAAERAAKALVEEVELEFVLVTLDREGMYLRVGGEPGRHLPTTPREVFDVTGAGDMVLSALSLGLAAGATPLEAAALANVAAGLEVERFGVVPVTRAEIAARLAGEPNGVLSKEVARPEIRSVVDAHRRAGRRIVFTNGCFDVLHAGHVHFLQAARREGDVLVVGVNADESVARLKGPDRPHNPRVDRVAVLSALAAVDHVVVFEEDTPAALVEEVAPDVLVKGEEWRERGVVGREFVEGRGGRVVLLPLHRGRSSTEILRRLRGEG